MKIFGKYIIVLLLISGMLWGCGEDDPVDPEAPEDVQKVNEFINTTMNTWYFWVNTMPDIDYRFEFDSKEYFEKLLSDIDKERGWSFITDDAESLLNSQQGIEEAYGWSLAFGKFENADEYFAIVEFVYSETPASALGLKRGDIIMQIDGQPVTNDNFRELFGGNVTSFTLGKRTENGITLGDNIDITAQVLNLNPVIKTRVVEHGGHKIGYMLYSQFIDKYNESIDTALTRFKQENITDLVLDLRYNPGGQITAAQHLCSAIGPLSVVSNNEVLVTYKWNSKRQEEFEEFNRMNWLEVYFDKSVDVKLGLNKVHVLIGPGTASASELTITGLSPYMDGGVTLIGNSTSGKYTFSIPFQPQDIYKSESYYQDINNWAVQPICGRYANAAGVTDFQDGFAADIRVDDDLANPLPLGDVQEPLFKAAIEDITGTEVILATKSAERKFPRFIVLDRGASKFEQFKSNTLMNLDIEKE